MQINRRQMLAGTAGLAALPLVNACKGMAGPEGKADVIVLGAGVSGLNTAWLLEKEGLKVIVLEARDRVGGRVLTLKDQPGYPEMGFNSMAAGYGRSIDAAKRAGVELVDVLPRYMADPRKKPATPVSPTQPVDRQLLVLGDKYYGRAEWAALPTNPLPAALKGMMPWEVVPMLVAKHNRLENWADWTNATAAQDISMAAFLKAQGLSDEAIKLVFDTAPYAGVTADKSAAIGYEWADGWVKTQQQAGMQSFAVKGGNYKLTEGMRNLVKGDVLLDKEVTGIASDEKGATITCRDGSSYAAKHVVCSLPYSTLRKVKIEPGLSGPQADAVAQLQYQPLSIAFLTVKGNFWDEDGLPVSMWTDGPAGNVLAQHYGEKVEELTGLSVFARGRLAQKWDAAGKDATLQSVVAELERIRPAMKGKIVGAAFHSWANEAYNLGDWAYFEPGQISRFGKDMSKPAGRVHFCGEHTATANRGIEGAMESSERAALEILSA